MPEINEKISQKLDDYPEPINIISKEIISFAQNMPEPAVKEHLDQLVRKAVKRQEAQS
jgi:hypothetical protein